MTPLLLLYIMSVPKIGPIEWIEIKYYILNEV